MVTQVENGVLHEFTWRPEDFGLTTTSLDGLRVDGPAASATIIRGVLEGQTGPARDIVVMNAGAGLIAAGAAVQPHNAASQAAVAIDGGAARRLLDELIKHSHAATNAGGPT
jgi:anthranilate phosphoribosyltransferase